MRKMDDPEVKAAIRLLQAKGVTLEEIEISYTYYDFLKANKLPNTSLADALKRY